MAIPPTRDQAESVLERLLSDVKGDVLGSHDRVFFEAIDEAESYYGEEFIKPYLAKYYQIARKKNGADY